MGKVKILTMSTSGFVNKEGISTVILDNFKKFNKNKFDLHLGVDGDYSYELVQEFEDAQVSIKFLPSRKKNILKYVNELSRLLKKEEYDALYVHGSSAIMTLELGIAKTLGCKVRIVHSHNTTCNHKKIDKFLRPVFYRLYTSALACGDEAGKWLFGDYPYEVIRNGRDVDTYKFNKNKRKLTRLKLELRANTIMIGHIGVFNHQKNQIFLIDVLKELIKITPNFRLYLIGDGQTKKEIMEAVSAANLTEYVIFTGSIQSVPYMFQAMDVMVLPSLHEGVPLVVVESQIAQIPSLVSDKVAKECAYSNYVHFLPLDNPKIWAQKIIEISKFERKNNDEIIRLTTENGYDLEGNVKSLEKYFLLNKN